VAGVKAVLRREVKAVRLEAALLTAHIATYLAVVFLVLPPLQAVVFIAVHQGMWGVYMGCSFARSQGHAHRVSRPAAGLPAQAGADLTERTGRPPNMPRANLWQARPIVPQFRAHNGIAHSQTSALGSYRQVLRHLHTVRADGCAPVCAGVVSRTRRPRRRRSRARGPGVDTRGSVKTASLSRQPASVAGRPSQETDMTSGPHSQSIPAQSLRLRLKAPGTTP
jgi:hypothetical protein